MSNNSSIPPSVPKIERVEVLVYRADGSLEHFDFDGHGHHLQFAVEHNYTQREEIGWGVMFQGGLTLKAAIEATEGSGPHPLMKVTRKEPPQ